MKSNRPPDPNKLKLNHSLKKDPQIIKWTQRLLGKPEARPTDLSEDELAFLVWSVNHQRGDNLSESAYARAMAKTCPHFAAPDFTHLETDLEILFAQPELIAFWNAWTGGRGKSGPAPKYAPSKAVMAVLGMGGTSSHVDTTLEIYGSSQKLQALFSTLEGDPVGTVPYSSACRHFPRLAPSCTELAIETNIALLKQLRKMFPNAGIGERILMDSASVPAWVQQRSSHGNGDLEKWINRRTPDAYAKAYSYGSNGKSELSAGDKVSVGGMSKFWRGYFFSVLVDQASGMPLVWMLHPAKDETASIIPLLSMLYRLWPDIPAAMIVADSLWDKPKWHRLCEVDYGLHPIFRQMPSSKTKAWIDVSSFSQSGSVDRITAQGQLVCAAHGKPLPYDSFDAPSRNGLAPGKSSDERLFRVRGKCTHTSAKFPHPCGRIGLKAEAKWDRLTHYPHHSDGHPDRYAMRQAMLTRLNQVEGVFNRLKAGKFLGNEGAARTRITDRGAVEALFSLACLSMTASLVADERMKAAKVTAPKPVAVKQTPTKPTTVGAAKPKALAVSMPALATSSATATIVAVPGVGVFKRGRRRVNLGSI